MPSKSQILWGLFTFNVFIILTRLLQGDLEWLRLLVLSIPALLLFLHALWTLSMRRGIFFITIASIIGFACEVIALNTGIIFGGEYVYQESTYMLLNVPLSVIVYWAVFIYIGYSFTNSFLYWLKKHKPNRKYKNMYAIPVLAGIDGLLVVSIDLFMDPLQVMMGKWQWLNGGPYFGVPVGNFFGWFFVAILVTGIYRFYEYWYPQKRVNIDATVFLIPVLEYGILAFAFAFYAISYQMYMLTLIGTILMLPPVLINIYLYFSFLNAPSNARKKVLNHK